MRRKANFAAAAAALVLALSGCDASAPGVDPDALYYQNGALAAAPPDFSEDVKEVEKLEDGSSETFTDYPKGYRLTFPAGMDYDLTLAEYVVVAKTEDFACTVSVERSPYVDVDGYLDFYQNRFYTNEHFREQNNIELLEDTTIETAGLKTRLITVSREHFGVYTYAYQYTGGQNYMRYLFQTDSFDEDYAAACRAVLDSYQAVKKYGAPVSTLKGWPAANPNWSPETAALYKKYQTKTDIDWGIFAADVYDTGINETIPAMEEKLSIPFEVVLMYQQLGIDVPVAALRKAHDDGKIIELTIQVSAQNNEDVYGYTPVFDLLGGSMDEDIRRLAAQIKDFGLPILFRLNNEMNSDWTSYCGIVTFSDPEIYKAVWRHVYDIFEEEGVDNCIWVFNPNDNDYPPSNWNNFTRYYPGDGYVHMIGVTGYNTGTYYRHVTGETWREFDEIYGEIERKYSQYFNWFPWMITEFGSSSIGGDKVGWIDRMFENIGKYENIKVAVWFSYADFDLREGKNGAVARPYWLDETPETLAAFARGRAKLREQGGSSTSLYPQGPFEETESAWRGVVIGRFKKEDVTWLLGKPDKAQGRALTYGDTVYTTGADGYVEKIEITGGVNTTDLRGVSVGDTASDLAAKFPQIESAGGDEIAITATEGSPSVTFKLKDGVVDSIVIEK
ncbi:MAG TPA: glycosyl hydrolase [Candidatus Acidoferrum sp.]|nr:glycosyl hydrolase [Candidatus Acidoferrum sp.]